MNNELAERGGQQSGQRFLNGSAPQLIRHAAPFRTAGRESSALPAGMDQKQFWGMGQNLAISAQVACVPYFASCTIQSPRGGHSGRYSGMSEADKR